MAGIKREMLIPLIGDDAGFQRNVEIAAAKNAQAFYVDIINRLFIKHWYQSSLIMDSMISTLCA